MTRPRQSTRKRNQETAVPGKPATNGRAGGRRPVAHDAIRWSRVATARARIAAGYYERADVQDLVVGAVLNELRRP